jgi:hypothetical protein
MAKFGKRLLFLRSETSSITKNFRFPKFGFYSDIVTRVKGISERNRREEMLSITPSIAKVVWRWK